MRSLHYILCLALLAPVWAKAKNLVIGETTGLENHSVTDEETDNYALKELLKDSSDSLKTSENATEYPGPNEDDRRGKILGGTDVGSGEYSFNVFVEGVTASDTGASSYCGGAILSVSWVITAASCVATAASVNVYPGEVSDPLAGTAITARVYVHPGFLRNFMINNIALLSLNTPLALSGTVSITKISSQPVAPLDNVPVLTFGFGSEDDTQELPATPTLKYIQTTIVKKSKCLSQTAETYVAYPGNTGCLSTSVATKGICFADAGGPVIYPSEADGTGKLIGINSEYLGCPSIYPSSFTLLHPYIGWIKSKTGKTFTS